MICDLCKNKIKTSKEKYVNVVDYNCGKIIKELWCHTNCFAKAMNKDLTELEKKAATMLDQAMPMLAQFMPEENKEYKLV